MRPKPHELLTLAEARRMFRGRDGDYVSRRTIARWITEGVRGRVLRTVRIGGRRFVPRKAVEEFCRQEPAGSAK